ncbi:MAG: DHH family phosphoesterase, partial [Anaerolineaceae bacterium]|nr:DHH family phosphoesterase [Anaerolineaceae bacterium]
MTANACEWVEPQPVSPPPDVLTLAGDDRLLADALVRRGLNTAETAQAFLDPTRYYIPTPPEELPDMDKAVERIEAAIRSGERVGVWGDFDVDGQTATALLVSGLRQLCADVVYYVPVRARESHGVAIAPLKSFLEKGVQLVITCDTGVSAADAVLYAQQQGIGFIVTDHHTLPPQLPPALAVVNPQRLEPNHPLSFLCGVGCAFKLVEALYQRAGRNPELELFYDLVAIGTIADMAELRGDNRY